MPAAIRVLIVEDVPADAELLGHELRRAGLDVDLRRVEEEGPFRSALDEFRPDVILSDFSLPCFDGLAAVRVTLERHPEIPVIIVTGSINEETAVRCLKAGAIDYLLKEHLGRLPSAVRTALERRQLVRAKAAAEQRLREEEEEARRQAQHQLLQLQKMEAIGRLVGGVAQDFNNLLTVIEGHGELLRAEVGNETPGRKRVEEILGAAARAASITRQLLAYTRQQVLEPRVLRLDKVVGEARHLLERALGEDVTLAVVAPKDLWRVRADPNQIVQILLNLAVNARDAMPRGGTLRIELADAELDDRFAAGHRPCPAGRYAMLAVSDTGLGMDAETQRRVFEPFFTTKEAGEGTGLGLSMVYGIVKQSGGYIWVSSEEGRGTTFEIYLPRVDEPEADVAAAPPARPTRVGGRILVVEDDPGVRGLMAELLEARGYTVRVAGSPAEALAWAESSSEPLDLLVTDVVMPGLGGPELANRLGALRPGLRILFVSGYAGDALARDGQIGPGRRFLSKPFSETALLQGVAEALAWWPGRPGPGGALN
jgi:signal transduction histidine kinase